MLAVEGKLRLLLLASFALLGVVLLFVMFGEKWDPSTNANVLVAIGTLALAGVTTWSVMTTNDLIAGEERRHQESFAPLVRLQFAPESGRGGMNAGFSGENIGQGLAIGVLVTISAVIEHDAWIEEPHPFNDEEWPRRKYEAVQSQRPYQVRGSPEGAFISTLARSSTIFHFEYQCSAIAPNGGEQQFYEKRIDDLRGLKATFTYARADYRDMFGNAFATIYDPGSQLGAYHWRRP